ncbi:rhodanese-like domain-containing protein [Acidovorax sp. ACV01]|uniref:rhodanese-like domain-containing protein n=1 Tax=Acidovorax sp. ACV01 TaxID=2769311 RepID=UPI001784958C|nr:rhodanese-like domain-containing protein [Acidovorax sp. ACV01]MBD9395264.1 rhodanese-like domain-containing protein [Acidovorax sp. ACV01]
MKISIYRLFKGAAFFLSTVPWCAISLAQISRPGDQIPDALKEISPVSEVCRRDAPKQGEKPVPSSGTYEVDLQCSITADALASMKIAGDSLVVDRRDASDFRSFHIEGAMSLGITDLVAKPYWRSKKVVLIGNGRAEAELYRECARLKSVGYRSVHVLRGGMPSWLNKNLPVVGYASEGVDLIEISAAELLIEAQNSYNIVLIDKSAIKERIDIGATYEIPNASVGAVKEFMEKYRKANPRSLTASVVLVSSIANEEIAHLRGLLSPNPLLVYKGSWEGVVSQQNANKAMWAAYARGPKVPGCGL